MNIKVDKIESDHVFDKFINNLIKCLYNFLEQLENYYQAYLSIVFGVNLKESLNHEHKKVESKYNDLKVRLTEFLAVITRDSAEIKQKFNEIKLLKENYEFYTNLMKKVSNNENDSDINNITSMYGYIQGQLNELIPVQYNKIIKLNNFKFYLKHGSIEYQSYSDQKIFSIPIKHLMKDLKKSIQKIGVDKEIKKEYSTLKKSFHEIESLSSYSDFTPLQSIEDTLADAGSLHANSETKKRKEHSTINYRSEVATDTRNVKKKKTRDIDDSDDEDNDIDDNDDDNDLIKSNSER
uniref:BVpp66c protein n=1 Tax=Chelonus inanitus TaxID=49201 RepID=D7FB29_9HYME|nr:BVpp66c protein [Chelonus inanitus]